MGEHKNNENFKTVASIVIKLRSNGTVHVEGPLQDKILSLGLLELAKQIVVNQKAEEPSKIIRPVLIPPADLGRG